MTENKSLLSTILIIIVVGLCFYWFRQVGPGNIGSPEISKTDISNPELEVLSCDYCDYKTTRNSNLKRHIASCKNRLSEESKYRLLYEKNEAEKKGLIEQHEKEKEMLYKQIDKLLENVGHTTNNIQNNIILNIICRMTYIF